MNLAAREAAPLRRVEPRAPADAPVLIDYGLRLASDLREIDFEARRAWFLAISLTWRPAAR